MLSEILLENQQQLEEKDKFIRDQARMIPRGIAQEMLQRGLDPELIASVTHLPLSEIRDMQRG